ncbi:hypothetical protein BC826DRAFT_433338 [Russula brevipes]|nr:hypothetical protein BC826DRAFT_433338 [Russula brevipes]
MSQADDQDPERAYGIDGRFSQSRPTPSQPSRGETNFGDSSGPLFSMYSKIAEDEDNKMVDQWQKDADGIIIFSGLFSAVLAALVVLSIQDLKQDTSAFYLQKIYELQADPNVSRSFTPEKPPTFSPSQSAIWVNVLWFLSLVMSLTCAMFATTLQQWARRYLRITQPARTSPHKRARMRAFFANGVDRFRVSWAAEALPALLHLSLFLFFAGLLIYLFDINFIVFNAVLCWVAFLSLVYGCVTMMPIFWHDSPYYAPFSSTAWFLYAIILYSIFEIPLVGSFCSLLLGLPPSIEELRNVRRGWIVGGAEGAAEETALGRASEIDVRIMEWTVDALGEDDTLERFFETIPGFYRSAVVKNLRQTLPENIESKILGTLDIFLRRTLSSNSVSGSIKGHRLAIYLNTASEVRTPHGVHTMFARVIRENWPGVPHSIDIGHYLKSWDKENNGRFTLYIQCIIAQIVATVQEHSDRWTTLATGLLGVSDGVLQAYLANGESLLLANLIHITRQITLSHWRPLGILHHFPNSTYATPSLNCNTNSARCGTKSFSKRRTACITGP